MKYTYTIPINYQDVDTSRRWRLYNMENALLQVAGDVANELGFGINALLPYGYTWILSRMDAEIQQLPTHGKRVTIETWIESNAHMLSTRNYRIYSGNDTSCPLIGQVSSVWAVLDLQSRQVVNAFDLPMFEGVVDGERLTLPRMPRMMNLTESQGEKEYQIKYSDLDYNGHCNSCKYLENMLNTYYPEWLTIPTPLRLTLQYSKEVMKNDKVNIRYKEYKFNDINNAVEWQMLNAQGETSATARVIQI